MSIFQPKREIFRKVSLDRLSSPEQLDQLMQVTTLRSWLFLAAIGCLVVVIALWGFFGSITVTAAASGALIETSNTPPLEAVFFVTPRDAARINAGMLVHVVPETVNSEQGYLLGTVKEIGDGQVEKERLTTVLGSETAVQNYLSQNASPVEVRVTLLTADTTSGYAWSTPKGAAIRLRPKTAVSGSIVISSQRPISMILSGVKN